MEDENKSKHTKILTKPAFDDRGAHETVIYYSGFESFSRPTNHDKTSTVYCSNGVSLLHPDKPENHYPGHTVQYTTCTQETVCDRITETCKNYARTKTNCESPLYPRLLFFFSRQIFLLTRMKQNTPIYGPGTVQPLTHTHTHTHPPHRYSKHKKAKIKMYSLRDKTLPPMQSRDECICGNNYLLDATAIYDTSGRCYRNILCV